MPSSGGYAVSLNLRGIYNEEATQKACKQEAAEQRTSGELKSTRNVYTSRSGTSDRVLPASQRVRPLPGFSGIGEMEPVSGYIRRYSECTRCLVVWDPESQESGSGLVSKRSPARLIYPAARGGGGPSGEGHAHWCRRLGAP